MESIPQEELLYLEETLDFLEKELEKETGILVKQRKVLTDANRKMWEETSHRNVTTETVPFLDDFLNTAKTAELSDKQVQKYSRMLQSPYFARFDFIEDGYEREKIYVGYYNLMDSKGSNVYVYDWRAPISSLYYRQELGKAQFESPGGIVFGEILLKRQYQIEFGKLNFCFDSSVAIKDDILIMALSTNANEKMKNIVETIQKEQDMVIRDLTNNVLIVQGVAGSGKTSVALHRVAYLLYETEKTKLTRNNIIILSPNSVFSDYIDSVLPSLGEESVETTILDNLFKKEFRQFHLQHKNRYLDSIISEKDEKRRQVRLDKTKFLCGRTMKKLLDRLAKYYEENFKFKDIVLDEKTLISKEELLNAFLDNKAGLTAQGRLKRLKTKALQLAEEMYPKISERLLNEIEENPKFRFEEKEQLEIAMKAYRRRFEKELSNLLSINVANAYSLLANENILKKCSEDIHLPNNTIKLFQAAAQAIRSKQLPYEVCSSMFYLKLILCGNSNTAHIRHVIIDEAQDYYPLHFHIFKALYPNAKFTVLGDKYQTISKSNINEINIDIGEILSSTKIAKVTLNKSYRSSLEISNFANSILDRAPSESDSVNRTGETPKVNVLENKSKIFLEMKKSILNYMENNRNSIAVLTKNMQQAQEVLDGLQNILPKELILSIFGTKNSTKVSKGIMIMPVYMAKGLEFDCVLVYGADAENYNTEFDRNLLYVAATRALHNLSIFAEKKLSSFVVFA